MSARPWMDPLLGPMAIEADGEELPQRATLSFAAGLTATDNEGADKTEITADLADDAGPGVVPALGVANTLPVSDGATITWQKVEYAQIDDGAALSAVVDVWRTSAPNVETLGSDKVLVASDSIWQALNPSAMPYSVELPTVSAGLCFRFYNTSGAQNLVVKNSGGSTIATVPFGETRWVVSGAAAWVDMGP